MSGVRLEKVVKAYGTVDAARGIHDGIIERVGSPMELFGNPANTFVASFLGSPPMNMLDATIEASPRGPVAVVAGRRLPLPRIEALRGDTGRPVTIGIRPEHARVAAPSANDAVPINVDLVEPPGSEALLHAELNGGPFVLKAESRGALRVAGEAAFTVDPDLIRVFDGETGRAIPTRARELAA